MSLKSRLKKLEDQARMSALKEKSIEQRVERLEAIIIGAKR